MKFALLDWAAVVGYLLITLLLGLYFRRRSSQSTEDYFVSGRDVSWWLAGTSMVATTFAADTPLAVSGLVYTQGIAGNWLWWSFLPSGMMTVFLFARLWRRSGLLTDVQFAEMRYAGRPAAFLRGFRALYLGLLMNCLILGWVTKAMTSIVGTTLGKSDATSLFICIFFLMPFTGFYVSLGGLWGVLWTDLFQFVLKMGIVIAVAYYGVKAVGGMGALLAKLAAMHTANGPAASDITGLLPDFSQGLTAEALWTLPVLTFLVHLGVQWWAFWYPGAEPGGGGYIAQRIFSARNERHGLLSVLWFNVAHYAVRPWPWILVGFVALLRYPGLANPEEGYVRVMVDILPTPWKGLLLATFAAAYMSTIGTHLNWGASYLVNDVYLRFIKPDAGRRAQVMASRLATVFLMLASLGVMAYLKSVEQGWKLLIGLGAGTGLVFILRWYWWRINAWSEISAMAASFITSIAVHAAHLNAGDTSSPDYAIAMLVTVGVTTVVWLAVTFLTPPESPETLERFYRRVRPGGAGWRTIARRLGFGNDPIPGGVLSWVNWAAGVVAVYSAVFSVGALVTGSPRGAAAYGALAIGAFALIQRNLRADTQLAASVDTARAAR